MGDTRGQQRHQTPSDAMVFKSAPVLNGCSGGRCGEPGDPGSGCATCPRTGALPWGIIPPATRTQATQRMSDCGQRSWPEKDKDDVPHHGHPASGDGQDGSPRGAPLSCTRRTWRRTPSTGLRMHNRPELQGHGAASVGGISCRYRVQFTSWSFDHGISLASERVCASSPA
jgi:hypothetical protein